MKSAIDEIKKMTNMLNVQKHKLMKAKDEIPKEQWSTFEPWINKAFANLKEKEKELKESLERLENSNLLKK